MKKNLKYFKAYQTPFFQHFSDIKFPSGNFFLRIPLLPYPLSHSQWVIVLGA